MKFKDFINYDVKTIIHNDFRLANMYVYDVITIYKNLINELLQKI